MDFEEQKSLAELWNEPEEAAPVQLPTEVSLSPRMRVIVDRATSAIDPSARDQVFEPLPKLDFRRVKAQCLVLAAGQQIHNVTRLALDSIWRDCDFACEREIRARTNAEPIPSAVPPPPRPQSLPAPRQSSSSSSNPYFKNKPQFPVARKAASESNLELHQSAAIQAMESKHVQALDKLWAVVEAMGEQSGLFVEYESAPAAFKPKLQKLPKSIALGNFKPY